jgi:hypothetical protein
VGARRKISARRLTKERIIAEAVKIIGSKADSAVIASYMDWVEWMCTGQRALRACSSKEAKRSERQVAAWLRRGRFLFRNLYCWPAGFEKFKADVNRWESVYETNIKERGRLVSLIKPPKLNTYPKRFAAMAALRLCEGYGLLPTSTKTGDFCKLAAVLCGEPNADLQHWCRWALASREINAAPPMEG